MREDKKWGINLLSANPTKWSNTQAIRQLLPANCLSVFGHFVGLALKVLFFWNYVLFVILANIQSLFYAKELNLTNIPTQCKCNAYGCHLWLHSFYIMDCFWRKKILWLLFSNSGHKLNFSEKFWGQNSILLVPWQFF